MSLSDEWAAVKAAWNDDTSADSPGTRFGLMFDPVRYSLKPFGLDDNYADLINKSGDESNRTLSHLFGSDDRGGWSANKPASTIGLLAASYFTGAGLMGGGGGGGAGGAGGGAQPWGGFFGNGGQGGMAGVGQGNAGQLFANTGINTGGVGGVGGTGGGMGGLLGSMTPQDMIQMGQGMGGQQQPQQTTVVQQAPQQDPRGQMLRMQLARNQRAQELRRKPFRTPQETMELRELTQTGLLNA
jgi:hypothetical protein